MPNLKVKVQGTNTYVDAKGAPDGSLVTMSFLQSLSLAGKIFFANVGSATTPVTLDAAYANTDPDISIDVPDGTSIIPIRITAIYEAFGTDAVVETSTLVTKTLGVASAGTAFVPINMRTRAAGGSRCAVYVGPTVTSGITPGAYELFRDCHQLAGTMAAGEAGPATKFEWNISKEGFAPVLDGESSLQTWATSQAASGYIQIVWAELPTIEIPAR